MEISINYFSPDKGGNVSVEDKIDILFEGNSEIYVKELDKTYANSFLNKVHLMNDVSEYFNTQSKVVALPASPTPPPVPEGVMPFAPAPQKVYVPKDPLKRYETITLVFLILTEIVLILSFYGAWACLFLSGAYATWLVWPWVIIICGILLSIFLCSHFLNFQIAVSKRIRILEEKLKDRNILP